MHLRRDTATMELASKLQLKPGQHLSGVQVPDSIAAALSGTLVGVDPTDATALLVFTVDSASVEEHRGRIVAAASRDHLTWVAYPKGGQLGTDLKRDSLVTLLEQSAIQPVRQISLDGVWSALRFRPA
jgi:hypothetical protein